MNPPCWMWKAERGGTAHTHIHRYSVAAGLFFIASPSPPTTTTSTTITTPGLAQPINQEKINEND